MLTIDCGKLEGMTDLQLFEFQDKPVRVVMIGDEPWFVLNDVCAVIEIAQPWTAAKRLDQRDLGTTKVTDSTDRLQETAIVNESGLYDLIFASRKEAAKEFKRKVTTEILPEIRKTGMYLGQMDLPTALERYAAALREKDVASKRAIEAEAKIDELRPGHTEWTAYMDSTGLCDLGALAQALGGGRQRLINRLRELGVLVSRDASQGGTRPMQPYSEQEQGWFAVRVEATNVGPVSVTYATPKGVSGVLRALVKHGVGEHRWGSLPAEDDLFARLAFQDDPSA